MILRFQTQEAILSEIQEMLIIHEELGTHRQCGSLGTEILDV